MLTKLNYSAPLELIEAALATPLPSSFKNTLNVPTGKFFYDKWKTRPEYVNTPWGDLLATLPKDVGEARVIFLEPGTCYNSHADIDDRYHLNLAGGYSFLVDLDAQQMYKTVRDGCWYAMDAGPRHSAVNFGDIPRVQLVVRQLLKQSALANPVSLVITPGDIDPGVARYEFDDTVSFWLNKAVKKGVVANFSFSANTGVVSFDTEKTVVNEVMAIMPSCFKVEINEQ